MMNRSFVIKNIKFSNREVEIISLAIQRMQYKEIGSILNISHNTVKNHIYNIIKKIGGTCRIDIIDFVKNSDSFELIESDARSKYGYDIKVSKFQTKNNIIKNTLITCWILIVFLYIYTSIMSLIS